MATRMNVLLASVAAAVLWSAAVASPLQAKGVNTGPPPSTPPAANGPNTNRSPGAPSNTMNDPNGPTVTLPQYGGGYGSYGGPNNLGPANSNPPADPNSPDQNARSSPPNSLQQNADAPNPTPATPVLPAAPDIKAALLESSQMQVAESAVRTAQNDYEAAVTTATQSLSTDPSYQAALVRQTNARDELRLLKLRADATPESIADSAQRVLASSSAVHEIESKALAADPNVVDTKARLAKAVQERDGVRSDVIASLHAKPPQP